MKRTEQPDGRAISPVVGSALMVVLVIVMATLVLALTTGITDRIPDTTASAAVEMDHSPAGLDMTPIAMDHPLVLEINGKEVTTIGVGDTGESVVLPVAPGDRIALIADTGRHRLVKQKRVSDSDAGDFIAYYTFEGGSGTTIEDRSANDNDATTSGTAWLEDGDGTAAEFDGSSHVKATGLDAGVSDVSEFTVAVKYRIAADTGSEHQLVEHHDPATGFEWYLESEPGPMPYEMEYSVMGTQVRTARTLTTGTTHVVVGTYDGERLRLFLDGEFVGSAPESSDVAVGDIYMGADAPAAGSQYLDGRLYQVRLYYTAFDNDSARMLSDVMEAEAE